MLIKSPVEHFEHMLQFSVSVDRLFWLLVNTDLKRTSRKAMSRRGSRADFCIKAPKKKEKRNKKKEKNEEEEEEG